MNGPPKISVIMAAFNSASFIGDAIASVRCQTEFNWELIITDDGSTDGSAEIVEAAAQIDRRVRILRHETAKGPAAARNTALREARGKWVAILDSDDAFAPDRLERMVAEAEWRQLDVLADNLTLVDFETRQDLGRAFPSEWMSDRELIDLHWVVNRNWPSQTDPLPFGVAKPLVRRSFLEREALLYDEDIRCGEDLLLYGRALLAGARFGLFDVALYFYSVRPTSLSRNRASWLSGFIDLCKVNDRFSLAAGGSDPALTQTLRQRSNALHYDVFSFSWKVGRFTSAWGSALRMPLSYILQRMGASALRQVQKLRWRCPKLKRGSRASRPAPATFRGGRGSGRIDALRSFEDDERTGR